MVGRGKQGCGQGVVPPRSGRRRAGKFLPCFAVGWLSLRRHGGDKVGKDFIFLLRREKDRAGVERQVGVHEGRAETEWRGRAGAFSGDGEDAGDGEETPLLGAGQQRGVQTPLRVSRLQARVRENTYRACAQGN